MPNFLLEGVGQFDGQFFRAREKHLHGAEIVRLAAPHVRPQKRRRGKHDRHAVLAAEFSHLAGFQRRIMIHALRIEREHRPKRDRVAEGMEERQNAQQHVVLGQADDFIDGVDVRADVVVREHDALGPARRAGSENHREQIVGLDCRQAEFAFQKRNRQQSGGGERKQLVGQRDVIFEIFEKDQFRVEFEIEPVEHAAAGQHVLDAALLDAIVHHLGSDRVVQIHADAAIESQRRVRDDSAGRRRQQHAHVLFVVGQALFAKPAAAPACGRAVRRR